jgi:hypothetical protein
VPETAHPFTGLVYRQALEHLHGVRDEAATRELIIRENRKYSRRQLIWFRKEPNLRWIHAAGERAETALQGLLASSRGSGDAPRCRLLVSPSPPLHSPIFRDVFLNYARREAPGSHPLDGWHGPSRGGSKISIALPSSSSMRRRSRGDLQARHRHHPIATADEQLLLLARSLIERAGRSRPCHPDRVRQRRVRRAARCR